MCDSPLSTPLNIAFPDYLVIAIFFSSAWDIWLCFIECVSSVSPVGIQFVADAQVSYKFISTWKLTILSRVRSISDATGKWENFFFIFCSNGFLEREVIISFLGVEGTPFSEKSFWYCRERHGRIKSQLEGWRHETMAKKKKNCWWPTTGVWAKKAWVENSVHWAYLYPPSFNGLLWCSVCKSRCFWFEATWATPFFFYFSRKGNRDGMAVTYSKNCSQKIFFLSVQQSGLL